jgi:putative membrane protein
MRRSTLLAAVLPLAILAAAAGASAQMASQNKPSRDAGDAVAKPVGMASATTLGSFTTPAFVQNAARGDMFEIRASKLAEEKSSSAEIKKFAAEMITAHTQTTAGLKAAIAEGHVKTPVPTKLDARRQGMLNNLRASSGAEFDKRYVAQQIAAHQETLDLMKGYADHGHNDALKAAAAKTAPLVQDHLDMAKALPGA